MGSTIHVIGSMMIDRVVRVRALPRAGETVAARSSATFAGGKGANQAAAAAKCGARVRMLGRTGADGRFIASALEAAGVNVDAVSTIDPVAGSATVLVAETGENAIVIAPESNTRIALAEIEAFLSSADPGDTVLFQNECACLSEGIAQASARALRVWLNAAPADASLRALRFEKLTGLVVNETEAEALTGERDPMRALESLAGRMPGGTVIVTLGAQGAVAAFGRARFAHRGFQVDAVDTVGCGDAFVGAYLAAMAQGCDIAQSLARANGAGALAAMHPGAIRALPTRDEVDAVAALPERTRLKSPPAGAPNAAVAPTACLGCGYDLKGRSVGERCPECGREIRLLVTASGALGRDALDELARGARRVTIGAGLLAVAPVAPTLLVVWWVFVPYAFAQAALMAWGTWTMAAAGLPDRQVRRLRILAVVRAVSYAIGWFFTPVLLQSVSRVLTPIGDILSTRPLPALFSGSVPLAILIADVLLVWLMREVADATGSTAPALWRQLARRAHLGVLLVLPVSVALGPGLGTLLTFLLWGGCVALAAKEVLEAVRAAILRTEDKLRTEPRRVG